MLWEARQQPSLFTTQLLNVSFCKALCVFLVFPLYSLKTQRRLWEKTAWKDHESKVLSKISNTQPQKLMTCILSRWAQTKTSESGFIRRHISGGFSKEKRWSLLAFWAFQCAVSAVVEFLFCFFHYLFAQLFSDGTFPNDHLSLF